MARGQETPAETVEKFRAHYLYSGNATESAAAVGIPESTGRDIAKRLSAEPAFVEDRRALRTRALDELVAMRMRIANKALERYESDDVDIAGGGENVTVIDKRADHGKLVIEAEKNAQHLAKIDKDNESNGEPLGDVTIRVFRTPQRDDDGGES